MKFMFLIFLFFIIGCSEKSTLISNCSDDLKIEISKNISACVKLKQDDFSKWVSTLSTIKARDSLHYSYFGTNDSISEMCASAYNDEKFGCKEKILYSSLTLEK